VSRDVTEHTREEQALRHSAERFRALIENSLDAIALVSPHGSILYAGPSTRRVIGYLPEELEGMDGFALFHPDDRPRVAALLKDLTRAPGQSIRMQYRSRHKSGSWRWIEAVGTNMLDNPAVAAIVLNYRDITDTKESVDALRKSDERYRAFVEQSSEGIWRFELGQPMPLHLSEEQQVAHIFRHAILAQCNDIMARMYGYRSSDRMQGRAMSELLPPENPDNMSTMRAFVRSGYRLVNAESHEPDSRGITRTFLNNIVGMEENGRLVRIWGTHRDITAQKHTEGKVTVLAHALRTISEGVYLTNTEGEILFANEALQRMFGYDERDLVGRHFGIMHPGRTRAGMIEEILGATIAGGWNGELSSISKSGHELLISLSTSVVRGDGDRPLALMGVARDITDQSRAGKLQDAVYRIAQAADAAPSLDALYSAVHGIISEVMPATNFYIALYDETLDLLEFPYFVDEVDIPLPPMKPGKGLTAYVLRNGRSLLCTEEVWDDLVRRGEVELVGVPSPIWLGVPLVAGSGTIGAMVVQHYANAAAYGPIEQHMLEFVSSQVARAIERKRSEVALRESEERYRQMFEDDLTGDFISTPEGRILACNPAFARIFGFASVDQAIRSDCSVLHKDDRSRENVFELVRTRRKLEYHEMELRRKDGRPIYVVANLIGMFNDDGQLTAVKGYLFDNTERKRLEDQLVQSQKMEAVGQLASGIAHDFNNVMSVALTAAQMIRTSDASQDALRYARMIEETTMRGAAIAKQLLQFSRAEASRLSPISLGHILNEVKKILDHSFPKTIEIRVSLNLKQGVIMGDEGQIHQVLLNLCINARDAMTSPSDPEGTGILTIALESADGARIRERFGTAAEGDYAVLRVIDTGTGIAPEVQRRMFDPFFTTKGIGKGTGLGLSIVHGIVKGHHGHIGVESTPELGTTFSVYFPIVAQEVPAGEIEDQPPAAGRGETLLIVEDEEILRTLMREVLTRAGYGIIEARDGEEGVKVFRERRADIALVISDMGLPRMAGEQVFRELKAIDPDVRVVFSTGYIREEKKQELLEAGAREFIHKPYRVEEMLRALRRVLDAAR
jgi:PAS domain S-box-containing protein